MCISSTVGGSFIVVLHLKQCVLVQYYGMVRYGLVHGILKRRERCRSNKIRQIKQLYQPSIKSVCQYKLPGAIMARWNF